MRFIDITKLKEAAGQLDWDAIRRRHLDQLRLLSVRERKKYIRDNPDWNLFQPAMLALSNRKCWYSEAPIGNNDFEIDHFRPKNRAKNDDGSPIKTNGYWWKTYDWDNYRLVGGLANKRRRDRLNPEKEVKGKGDYFPLDLNPNNGGRIADEFAPLSCELPMLLDPTSAYDITLITYDEKGEPIPASEEEYEVNRVKLSIFYYHLDLDQLTRERKIAWDDCVDEIQSAKKAIDESPNEPAKRLMLDKCFRKLKDYVQNKDRSYTSVYKACIMVHSELKGYKWLKNLVEKL